MRRNRPGTKRPNRDRARATAARNGSAASGIPQPHLKYQPSFRARLALSTALATIAFGYGNRGVYAGACVVNGGAGTYLCSGAANPGVDVTNGGLTNPLNPGTALTVTTDPGFGHNVTTPASSAFDIIGTGGVSFADNNASAISGTYRGISAVTNTSGATTITTNGQVAGGTGAGIYANNTGSGTLTVISTGTVTGAGNGAINAINSAAGTDITVTAVNVTGAAQGIRTVQSGSGTSTHQCQRHRHRRDGGGYRDCRRD
ncbi:MAG: hypothetical protein GKS01_19990 [Alphaproteobacteria bacterium]|nr:hypothetical protein [Alphaproteobacteria bacterium]